MSADKLAPHLVLLAKDAEQLLVRVEETEKLMASTSETLAGALRRMRQSCVSLCRAVEDPRSKQQRRQDQLRGRGLCVVCGSEKIAEARSRSRCGGCLDRQRDRMQERRRRP